MDEVSSDSCYADQGFYRTMCLERVKDLYSEIRHLETQALKVVSHMLLITAGLASVLAYFVSHLDKDPPPKMVLALGIPIVLALSGLFLIAFILPLQGRAERAHEKVSEIIKYLITRGELPEDMPNLSLEAAGNGGRRRRILWTHRPTYDYSESLFVFHGVNWFLMVWLGLSLALLLLFLLQLRF